MLRFDQHSFSLRPEKDGAYIVVNNDGVVETFTFTVEKGWNTYRHTDGSLYARTGIPDSFMTRYYKCWLSKHTIGTNYWFDEIETTLDEVKADLKNYDERKLTEDEMERCDNLEELRDVLERAKEIAEVFA